MPKLTVEPYPDEDEWLRAIGGFIWRMGQLEYLSLEWCYRLGGAGLRDQAISKAGFGARYELVVRAINSTAWPEAKKNNALRLWRAAKCFSAFRNKVAHAPVVSVRGVSVLLDARSLLGQGKRPVMVYRPEFINSIAEKIQGLAQKLDWSFE